MLGFHAALAVCLLFRAQTMEDDGAGIANSLRAQSDHHFQLAVAQLQSAEEEVELEGKLQALVDLALHQVSHTSRVCLLHGSAGSD